VAHDFSRPAPYVDQLRFEALLALRLRCAEAGQGTAVPFRAPLSSSGPPPLRRGCCAERIFLPKSNTLPKNQKAGVASSMVFASGPECFPQECCLFAGIPTGYGS
jgi:hypothetical protein